MANYEFNKFIKRLNYKYNIKSQYSVVIEFQKRGAIHYHVILYNLTEKIKVNEITSLWGNGHIKINAIDKVDNVGAYICKYMTKTDDIRLYGRKMYFSSKHLKKPIEHKNKGSGDELLSHLVHTKTPTYENTFTNEYNVVLYQQYNLNIQ